ncbi:MAG: D-2-hydroxyacid dehydrogenase [Bacteroidota bacterium]|nr:D-2-hydroxyacid dehydrogenase [Bacteroidota bacterium]
MKILANDGIDQSAKELLESKGFTVETNKISQEELASRISEFDVLLVRSATKVNAAVIEAGAPNLKLVGRAGVGLDNVDLVSAKANDVAVVNTPAASSTSVAELVFAHLFSICRLLQVTNREMPENGMTQFNELKKLASKGTELKGKTLGLIGFGRIGRETARIAFGLGMNVVAYDPMIASHDVEITFHPESNLPTVKINIQTISKEEVLKQADFVSLHIPGGQGYVIAAAELALMKKGAGLVNCARGGTVSEEDLIAALNSGHIAYAGTDVFEKEPPVNDAILKMKNVSLSPHIGASTEEAQKRIGDEIAQQILTFFNL